MGCCLDCLKSFGLAGSPHDDIDPSEITPLHQASTRQAPPATKSEKKSYKSVIQEAQRKFISSSTRHRNSSVSIDVESIRIKLGGVTADINTISPPLKESAIKSALGSSGNVSGAKSPENTNRAARIVEVLSQPVSLSTHVDRAFEEAASALLAAGEFTSGGPSASNDDSQSALVLFKPVTSKLNAS